MSRRRSLEAFRRGYGAGPFHLLGWIASLIVAGIAANGWFDRAPISTMRVLIWFVGAVLAHDLVVLPLYSLIDRIGLGRKRARPASQTGTGGRAPGWVYVRIPLILSGLMLLAFAPEILRLGNDKFEIASGQTQNVYLGRYLIASAALFGISALAYSRARVRRPPPEPAPSQQAGEQPAAGGW